MKKIIRMILVFSICFSFNWMNAFASTNTFERTSDNYRIASWITVTDSNRDNILQTPAVDASEKVYDYADLFTADEEMQLYSKISDYIASANMDLAVVTINENNKGSQAIYADDFYDYNDFGVGTGRDGVLFLIDMQYRQIYMSTTGYAINMYNDYRIDRVLDAVYRYMSDENYYDGVSEFISIIKNDAISGLPSDEYVDSSTSFQDAILYAIIGSAIITGIIMFILIRKNKLVRPATTAREYLDDKSVIVNNMGDVLISSNTVKHRIEHSSSSGGGSSTHSGSSGGSHGGGGHGF